MKNFLSLIVAAGFFSLVACGPSAEEKQQMEADAQAEVEALFNELETEVTEETTEEVAEEAVVEDSTATEQAN